jgi:hypothetical protein
MRTARLAKFLASDHNLDITWWGSTYCHQSKKNIFDKSKTILLKKNYRLILLKSMPYSKNISLARLMNHMQLGIKYFIEACKERNKPDIIISSFPTIEFTLFSVIYGLINKVPVVIDVRDKWPEIFYKDKSFIQKFIIKLFTTPYYLLSYYSFKYSTTIVAVSEGYLNWAKNYYRITLKNKLLSVIEIGFSDSPNKIIIEKIKKEKKLIKFWFFGSLGNTYDLKTVLEGLNLLPNKYKQRIKLIISGTGQNLENLKKIKTDYTVEFTGWVGEELKIHIGNDVDIGILAYQTQAPQGLPNKIFDYMNFKLPVICSLEGESKKYITKNKIGWHYKAGDKYHLCNVVKNNIFINVDNKTSVIYNVNNLRSNYTENKTNAKWKSLLINTYNKYYGKR